MTKTSSKRRVVIASCISIAAIAIAAGVCLFTSDNSNPVASQAALGPGGVQWDTYSEQNLRRYISAGKIVFVYVTEQRCWQCQQNEQIITSGLVQAKMRAAGVVILKADWTAHRSVDIQRLLNSFGRRDPPLTVIYTNRRQSGIVLSDRLDTTTVTRAIDQASF